MGPRIEKNSMDSSYDVPDPSDWLHTPVSQLGPLEAALRCQVCKDFFNTPMITSCSHTFCSLCIRRCLTADGRCPTCRTQDQEIKLRSNPLVQELVELFQIARPRILQLGEDVKASTEKQAEVKRSLKRKIEDTDIEDSEAHGKAKVEGRNTRSRSRTQAATPNLAVDEDFEDVNDIDFQPDDGLSACPICNERMKEEAVFSHLDIHNEPDAEPDTNPIPTRSPHFNDKPFSSRPPPRTLERLPQLNYSLLKDNALRKKLSEIGIPNGGPRALLIRRHTEWINLVNANCDSAKPRIKRELLHELEIWDKTQGRQILNSNNGGGSSSSVMNKDFDGVAWAASHENDFHTLIALARQKVNPKPEHEENAKEAGNSARAEGDSDLEVLDKTPTKDAQNGEADGRSPLHDDADVSRPHRILSKNRTLLEINAKD